MACSSSRSVLGSYFRGGHSDDQELALIHAAALVLRSLQFFACLVWPANGLQSLTSVPSITAGARITYLLPSASRRLRGTTGASPASVGQPQAVKHACRSHASEHTATEALDRPSRLLPAAASRDLRPAARGRPGRRCHAAAAPAEAGEQAMATGALNGMAPGGGNNAACAAAGPLHGIVTSHLLCPHSLCRQWQQPTAKYDPTSSTSARAAQALRPGKLRGVWAHRS